MAKRAPEQPILLNYPTRNKVLLNEMNHADVKNGEQLFLDCTNDTEAVASFFRPKAFNNFIRHTTSGSAPIADVDGLDLEKDNMLIQGNNLVVLHSLKECYAEKVKLIYIDIPYNTGSDGFVYNDKFSRSVWLTFMQNRLEVALTLMKPDGSIFIHVNDAQMAYLKVLCDEVFGEQNILNTIVVKTRDSAGVSGKDGTKGLRSNKEYILLYAKDKTQVALNPLKLYTDFQQTLQSGAGSMYTSIMMSEGVREMVKEVSTAQSGKIAVFKHSDYKISTVSEVAKAEKVEIVDIYRKYRKAIYRTTNAQSSIAKLVAESTQGITDTQLFSIDYVPTKGRNVGKLTTVLYSGNKRRIHASFEHVSSDNEGTISQTAPVSDLWADIKFNGIASEGGITLKNGKKPEKLMHRIISMGSNKGDLVLDFFLGSGTTAAVAHKMGRQYIGIESMDYGDNSAIKRLNNVIAGERSGISTLSSIDWNGGGSFVSFSLMQNDQAKTLSDKYIGFSDIHTPSVNITPADIAGNRSLYGNDDKDVCYTND